MSNEAAERMRRWIGETGIEGELDLFDAALAAERKATVERIRTAVHADTPKVPDIGTSIAAWLDAILDAEAAREGVQ